MARNAHVARHALLQDLVQAVRSQQLQEGLALGRGQVGLVHAFEEARRKVGQDEGQRGGQKRGQNVDRPDQRGRIDHYPRRTHRGHDRGQRRPAGRGQRRDRGKRQPQIGAPEAETAFDVQQQQ